jgi:hypothetical protein
MCKAVKTRRVIRCGLPSQTTITKQGLHDFLTREKMCGLCYCPYYFCYFYYSLKAVSILCFSRGGDRLDRQFFLRPLWISYFLFLSSKLQDLVLLTLVRLS